MDATTEKTRLKVTRRDGESLIINGPAVIKLVNSDRGRAELLIEASRSTIIERLEIAAPPLPN